MCNKGSVWRRWEMHLHTPGTMKEDRYTGSTDEEKWDNFYSSISNYVGDMTDPQKVICAIAITDYLSVDNFFKVKTDSRLPDCVKLVLPNVEMRMAPIAKDSPINIHCVFDPKIANELENRFFSRLKIEYNNSSFNATKNDLIRLGKCFLGKDSITDENAFHAGLNQFVISYNVLLEVFNADPDLREHTIIIVSNKSNDGVSGLRTHSDYFDNTTSQMEATRRAIYQLSDMVYSSNPKDIKYFLGEGPDNIETVKFKCGSLMPCVHGCDAHSNERIFSPIDEKYCWIKADPTFEGLKQVLYEPKERVRISSIKPEVKPSYYVIDRIEIHDNEYFSSEPIFLGDKLSCIIGGKSTGKSLLLHNIALAIDPEQVTKKEETAKTNVRAVTGLKVYWADGVSSDEKNKQRKIVYVPQTYLNRLSDEEQETTEIDKIIQSIVLQNKQCDDSFQQMQSDITNKKQELAKVIVDFLHVVDEKNRLEEECSEIGSKESILKEIELMGIQMDKLSKEYNVTEEDVSAYQNAVEYVQTINKEKSIITRECVALGDIDSVVEKKLITFSFIQYGELVDKGIALTIEEANKVWCKHRGSILSDAEQRLQEIHRIIEKQTKIIDALKPKMDGNEQIRELSDRILEEKQRLSKINDKLSQLETIQARYNEKISWLSTCFEGFSEIYAAYADCVNKNSDFQTDDLVFSVNKVFRIDSLQKKIEEVLDRRSFSRFNVFNIREINEQSFMPNNLKALIESLLKNTSSSLQFKNSYNIESGLREILTDWYNIDYSVKMDNDSIQEMSPGKKALVLLRLLISLADSKCPILIDQPEDDLDNRSILDELISFIRKKKIDRQIITVTHNANIVLGGDAELVIVANQDGTNSPNRQFKFEYRGGSIEDDSPLYDDNGVELPGILNKKGIQEHICEILEGGKRAFDLRRHKYHFIDKG